MTCQQSPRQTIAAAPMGRFQISLVALCILLNVADGVDVISMAVAAPTLAKDWHIKVQMLGAVFSATSVGLALGAFLIAPLAGRFGRRAVMLASLVLIAVSLLATWTSISAPMLIGLRLVTGVGLGALVVSLTAMVSEYSSDARRNLLIAILHTGFTLGMIAGGAVAVVIIRPFGGRSVFLAAGLLNTITLVVAWFLLPDSSDYLVTKRPMRALERLNRVFGRMGLPPFAEMPPAPTTSARSPGTPAGLAPAIRSRTLLLWLASLSYAIAGYFLLYWTPHMLVQAGLPADLAGISPMVTGTGGLLGHLVMGVLARNGGEVKLTALFFFLAACSMAVFGLQPGHPAWLLANAGVNSFCITASYTGLFLVASAFYPGVARDTGMGLMVGWGRVGAVVGPGLGGLLLGADQSRTQLFLMFAVVALVPALAMALASRTPASLIAADAAA
jgi:predicted MFS family arabinose efflux permease